jgi:hypothetical protein
MLEEGNNDFECLFITYNNNDVIIKKKLVPKFLMYKEETFTKCKFFSHYVEPGKFHTMKIL